MNNTSILSDQAIIASKFINQTDRNIFLTGKAGTGKTTFLRHIIKTTHKKTIIAAPTGIAAINAGGVTIHSLFQLPFGAFVPKHRSEVPFLEDGIFNTITSIAANNKMHANKKQLLKEMELLIIDEVSMLRADLLDAIDTVLRVVRKKSNIPFGGVQCLFIGDLMQLPPVVKDHEWNVLKNYYKSIFFFDAVALKDEKPIYIELDKVFRQSDETFISVLNNLRNNLVSEKDIAILNQYYQPDYKAETKENIITLTTHNYKADSINQEFLDKLKGKTFSYEAEIEDEFSESSYPLDKQLQLKVGAQVMFVKNDSSGNQRYFNGKIGKVSSLSDNSIDVEFEDGKVIKVEKYEWENKKFSLNTKTNEIEESTIGKFIHYPIKLAWAITVHKSQGLTFEKAIIDVGQAFAPGQVYVALSRLKSLSGLILTSKINYNSVGTDHSVSDYAKSGALQESPALSLENHTITFLKNYLLNCFDFNELNINAAEHFGQYKAKEKKTIRSKYFDWAMETKTNTSEITATADKFRYQIEKILFEKNNDYLATLEKRVNDAKNYFEPTLKKISSQLNQMIEELKDEKKSRQYAKELFLLEIHYFEQRKKLTKAIALCKSVLSGQEYTKEENEKLIEIQKKETESKVNHTEVEEKKKATTKGKELSFKLYKEGKTIEEIAQLRNYSISTVENHLAHYIKTKDIKVEELVHSNKIKEIIAVKNELQTNLLNPIKSLLGDEYSYSEIKFVLASIGQENFEG